MEPEIIKEYTNGELTIVWKPAGCIHSRNCWNAVTGMPHVFNPRERPWIKMGTESSQRIAEQVSKCPSGALSFYYNKDKPAVETAKPVRVQALPGGPLLVHGELDVELPDGTSLRKSNVTAFCRCGFSANKPYCDGSHNVKGFQG